MKPKQMLMLVASEHSIVIIKNLYGLWRGRSAGVGAFWVKTQQCGLSHDKKRCRFLSRERKRE
jgi:hypothetical protein